MIDVHIPGRGDIQLKYAVFDVNGTLATDGQLIAGIEPLIAHGGLMVINSSLIEAEPTRTDIEALLMPCTQIARDAGDDRLVSIVALGGLIARRPIVNQDSVYAAIRELLTGKKAQLIEADIAAFEHGYAAGLVGSAQELDNRVLADVWR